MPGRIAEIWQEIRHGARLLARDPGYALIVTVTLALGIGATTAVFSVLYASALAPLPYPDSDRLFLVEIRDAEGRGGIVPFDRLETWRQASETLDGAAYALMGQLNFTMSGDSGAERIQAEQVDFHTLRVFGVQPLLGRWFQPDEVLVQGNTSSTIVISYSLWQSAFGGDPDVIGKELPGWTADWGNTVIGVMPPGFYTHPSRSNTDAWNILTVNAGATIARLKPGVHPDQAAAELAGLGVDLFDQADGPFDVQLTQLQDVYRTGYAEPILMLLGAVLFVLLIASVNVANMQLSRGFQRHGEMATRAALGAGRWSLLRQTLLEAAPLTVLGGAMGLLIAFIGIRLFVRVAPGFYPPSQEITVNAPVLAFAVAVSVAASILSAIVPGLNAWTPGLVSALKDGGRGVVGPGRLGLRRGLVVVEVALAMVLLVGAGLMISSYARLTRVPMGFDADNLLSMEINLMGMDRYRIREPGQWTATPEVSRLYSAAIERIRALPGVEAVASTSDLPPGGGMTLPFRVVGQSFAEDNGPFVAYHEVSPGYFQTMRIPMVQGRAFTELDSAGAPGVAIVNEAFVRGYLDTGDAIGQRLSVAINGPNAGLDDDREREIVGVVEDTRMSFTLDPMPTVYIPYAQNLERYASNFLIAIHVQHQFVVRAENPAALAPLVRQAFAEVDDSVAVSEMMPMQARLGQMAGAQEFWMRLLGIFAVLGTFLAATGVYGVISYAVDQRMHEFGIRATLGAQRIDILRLVLKEGLIVAMIGVAVGVLGALATTQLIANQLYGVGAMDPVTIAAVAILLLVVAVLACTLPGLRAARLDPSIALRTE